MQKWLKKLIEVMDENAARQEDIGVKGRQEKFLVVAVVTICHNITKFKQ